MSTDWWTAGEICDNCGIPFCQAHRPLARRRQVWVAPHGSAYHTSPQCGAVAGGIKARERGYVPAQLDLDGGQPDGVVRARWTTPPGWMRLSEAAAVARGLPACLSCAALRRAR
ncbi:MAG: hypothetical protein ACYCXN_08135 [Acidimicrobiales bacterium]